MVWPQLGTSDRLVPARDRLADEAADPPAGSRPAALLARSADERPRVQEPRVPYQAYGRYAGGYGLPELAWGSTGADAA